MAPRFGYRRSTYRRRNVNRRRGNNRNRNNNLFKRKVQNVSNKPYIKPRRPGFGNITTNITRRLMAYPSSGVPPSPEKPAPKSSWWLDSLSWLASVALQLVGVLVAGSDENEKKFYIVGAATRINIDAGFILQSSPIGIVKGTSLQIPFEQFRILWLRFVITPVVDVSRRGGSYACAIVPLDHGGDPNDVEIDFDSVIRQPGSIIRPIDKPCSVSWSPSILEYGLKWHDIKGAEDLPVCVFVITFSDLALNKPDMGGIGSEEYCPQKAGFEIIVESRVETRRAGFTERSVEMNYADPSVVKVMGLNERFEVLHSSVRWENGYGIVHGGDIIDVVDGRSDASSCLGDVEVV